MMDASMDRDTLVRSVRQLPPAEQLSVVTEILNGLQHDIEQDEEPRKPLRSLWGLWADMGTAPSAEEIDEARREMWGNFPRDDF